MGRLIGRIVAIMGILGNIRKGITGQGRGSASAETAIVDALQLVGSSGRSSGPREKVQALKKLAAFAEKEAISMTAVLPGPPLREAADGDKYKGMVVRYAKKNEFPQMVGKIAKKTAAKTSTVVITADPDTEKRAAAAGALVMQTATLKKALGAEDECPKNSNSGGNKRRRGGGKRQPRKQAQPPVEMSEEDRIIRDLVDPL
jgi:hypothetical protein